MLFITCHDLGQHLGCYGQSSVTSPALDRLAAGGVRLARSFCTAPQCSPSRASLHTGMYPHAAGVLGLAHPPYGWRLSASVPHLAQMLGGTGYTTTLVGMQHLIDRGSAEELGYTDVLPVAPAYEEADATLALLHELSRNDRPFYLEVGFEEPHRPYDFGGAKPDTSKGVNVPSYLPEAPESREDFAAFQGSIRQMDEAVGRILAGLDDLGMAESTLVVFATDHGAAMPRAKCTLYDPGIEVAILLRVPGVRSGQVLSPLISNVDITPTLLDALGIASPAPLQGHSFWPLLRGESFEPRNEVFAEKTFHTYYEPMRAIRTDDHKLIVNLELSTRVDVPTDIRQSPIYPLVHAQFDDVRPFLELYDLRPDPWEQNNVAGLADYAAAESDLRGRLLEWMRATNDPILNGPVASPYYGQALTMLGAT